MKNADLANLGTKLEPIVPLMTEELVEESQTSKTKIDLPICRNEERALVDL